MTQENVKERIISVISQELMMNESDINENDCAKKDLKADSLNVQNIISRVKCELGVLLDSCEEKILTESDFTVGELVSIATNAEKWKREHTDGKFLTCMFSFGKFRKGEKYWFEHVGNNDYIGRSDNILNEKFVLTPTQLSLFVNIPEYAEGHLDNMIDWLDDWFYGVRTWGLTGGESNEQFCMRHAIEAGLDFYEKTNTPGK